MNSKWTAIIPAAGQGSRLNYHLPKVLYPILGKPMIHWMIELLSPFCSGFVFVLSPENRASIEASIQEVLTIDRYQIALQNTPTGMADAVLLGSQKVKTPHCIIAWGDQVTLSAKTLQACVALHESRPNSLLTLPTVFKSSPYIHFERDSSGKITRVLQKRENEIHIDQGESDCGLFLFETQTLRETLSRAKQEGAAQGSNTKEFNLLPLIPKFEKGPGSLMSLSIEDETETLGVNTREEAERVSSILTMRREQRTHV